MSDFEERLKFGKEGEDEVYKYLIQRGWNLIPVVPVNKDIGQRVYVLDSDYPSVDTIAFKNGKTRWIEVKHRAAPSFYQDTWTVGMSKYYFNSYYKMQQESSIPVYIFFLIDWRDNDTPFGLYDKSLSMLCDTVHSRTKLSLFWDVEKLRKLSDYIND